MLCVQCGFSLTDSAKFCSSCGTAAVPPNSGDAYPAVSVIVAGETAEALAARERIIERADTAIMQECAHYALSVNDPQEADFWYLELITPEVASQTDVVDGVLEYVEAVLIPEQRFAEAELYIREASQTQVGARDRIAERLEQVDQARLSAGCTRFQSNGSWLDTDISRPLDPESHPEIQYRRSMAWLQARAQQSEDIARLTNSADPAHMSWLTGFVIGMRKGLENAGGDVEAGLQGLIDWIQYARTPGNRVLGSQTMRTPAPAENKLGNHITRLVADSKWALQIKHGFGVTDRLNSDLCVAVLNVSAKLGDAEDWASTLLIFTTEQVGIFKKGGVFSAEETLVFSKSQVRSVGIGESDHYEATGLVGRSTQWVSITLNLDSGQRYTRHYFLGHAEREINQNVTHLSSAFEQMASSGYQLEDGPAWNSQGGYSMSFGYGIWR